jgi:hypothetical protein
MSRFRDRPAALGADTPILAPLPKEAITRMVASIPIWRVASADKIAKVAVFLTADDPPSA